MCNEVLIRLEDGGDGGQGQLDEENGEDKYKLLQSEPPHALPRQREIGVSEDQKGRNLRT